MMNLLWVVKTGDEDEFIIGIENCADGKLDPVCTADYVWQAKLIRDALEAHIIPRDYYRLLISGSHAGRSSA